MATLSSHFREASEEQESLYSLKFFGFGKDDDIRSDSFNTHDAGPTASSECEAEPLTGEGGAARGGCPVRSGSNLWLPLWESYVAGDINPVQLCTRLVQTVVDRGGDGPWCKASADWVMAPLPIPVIHVIAEALREVCRSRKDSCGSSSVVYLVELLLRNPLNHRAFVFAHMYDPVVLGRCEAPSPGDRFASDTNGSCTLSLSSSSSHLPLSAHSAGGRGGAPDVMLALVQLLELDGGEFVGSALACIDHMLRAVSTSSSGNFCYWPATELASRCNAGSTLSNRCRDSTWSGTPLKVFSHWRSPLTSTDAAAALGVTAHPERLLRSLVLPHLGDSELSYRVRHGVLSLCLEHLPSMSLLSVEFPTPQRCGFVQREVDLCVVLFTALWRLMADARNPVLALHPEALLVDLHRLLHCHNLAVVNDAFADASESSSRSPSPTPRPPAVETPFADESTQHSGTGSGSAPFLVEFLSFVVRHLQTTDAAATDGRDSVDAASSEAVVCSTHALVQRLWNAIVALRCESQRLIDIANILDAKRLHICRSSAPATTATAQSPSTSTSKSVVVVDVRLPLLEELSNRLHSVANFLDALPLHAVREVWRHHRQSAPSALFSDLYHEWLQQELDHTVAVVKTVLTHRGLSPQLVDQVAASAPSSPSRPQTPTSTSGEHALRGSGLSASDEGSPFIKLNLSIHSLFGRNWAAEYATAAAGDEVAEIRAVYELWWDHGFCDLLLVASTDAVVVQSSTELSSDAGPLDSANSCSSALPAALRLFLFSFMFCRPSLRHQHVHALLKMLTHWAEDKDPKEHGETQLANVTLGVQAMSLMFRFWNDLASARPTRRDALRSVNSYSDTDNEWDLPLAHELLDVLDRWVTMRASVLLHHHRCASALHLVYVDRKLHSIAEGVFSSQGLAAAVAKTVVRRAPVVENAYPARGAVVSVDGGRGEDGDDECSPEWSRERLLLVERLFSHHVHLLHRLIVHIAVDANMPALLQPLLATVAEVAELRLSAAAAKPRSHSAASASQLSPELEEYRRLFKVFNHMCILVEQRAVELENEAHHHHHHQSADDDGSGTMAGVIAAPGMTDKVSSDDILRVLLDAVADATTLGTFPGRGLDSFLTEAPTALASAGQASPGSLPDAAAPIKAQHAAWLANCLEAQQNLVAFRPVDDDSFRRFWRVVEGRGQELAEVIVQLCVSAVDLDAMKPINSEAVSSGAHHQRQPQQHRHNNNRHRNTHAGKRCHRVLCICEALRHLGALREGSGSSEEAKWKINVRPSHSSPVNANASCTTLVLHVVVRILPLVLDGMSVLTFDDFTRLLRSVLGVDVTDPLAKRAIPLSEVLPDTSAVLVAVFQLLDELRCRSPSVEASAVQSVCLAALQLYLVTDGSTVALEALLRLVDPFRPRAPCAAQLATVATPQELSHTQSDYEGRLTAATMAVVLAALRGNATTRVPRHFIAFPLKRLHCGIVRRTPTRFPTPNGFAVSAWVFPASHYSVDYTTIATGGESHLGVGSHVNGYDGTAAAAAAAAAGHNAAHETMALLAFYHQHPRELLLARKEQHLVAHAPSASLPPLHSAPRTNSFDISRERYCAMEILLQRVGPVDDDAGGGLTTSSFGELNETRPPTTAGPSGTSGTTRALHRHGLRVYLRFPELQFTVGFLNGIVPAEVWSHIVVSAAYDTTEKRCDVTLYMDGKEIETTSITPPKLRCGFMLIGASSTSSAPASCTVEEDVHENRTATSRSANSHATTTVSATPTTPVAQMDALFVGRLGPMVLWRRSLSSSDVKFLFEHPQLELTRQASTYPTMECLKDFAVQLHASRLDDEVALWGNSCNNNNNNTAHIARLRQRIRSSSTADAIDGIMSLGGPATVLGPLLLSLIPRSDVESCAQHNADNTSPALLLSALPPPPPRLRLLLDVLRRGGLAEGAAGGAPRASGLLAADAPSALGDLLTVAFAACLKAPADESTCFISLLAHVIPVVPHLLNASVGAPIVTLLRDTSVDPGMRSLFLAVLHELVLRFDLWSTSDAAIQRDVCVLFLQALRTDPQVLLAVREACCSVIPRLLAHSRSHLLRGPEHHSTLRRARLLALDTAALIIPPPRQTVTPNSEHEISLHYVQFLRHALLAAAAAAGGGTSSCEQPSRNDDDGRRCRPVTANADEVQQQEETTTTKRRKVPTSLLYESVMAVTTALVRCKSLGNAPLLQQFIYHRLQDSFVEAFCFGYHSVPIQRCVVVSLSILLHAAPRQLPVAIRGRQHLLSVVPGTAPVGLAPLVALLNDVAELSPPLCTAVWELSTETFEALSLPKQCSSVPLSVLCDQGRPLKLPVVVPLLLELVSEEARRRSRCRESTAAEPRETSDTASTSRAASLQSTINRDSPQHSLDIPELLHAIALSVQQRDTVEVADAVVNPLTMTTLWLTRERLRASASAPQQQPQPDSLPTAAFSSASLASLTQMDAEPAASRSAACDDTSIPRLLGVCCSKLLTQRPSTSWVILWHCVEALRNAASQNEAVRSDEAVDSGPVDDGEDIDRQAEREEGTAASAAASAAPQESHLLGVAQFARYTTEAIHETVFATWSDGTNDVGEPSAVAHARPNRSISDIVRLLMPLCCFIESCVAHRYLSHNTAIGGECGFACFEASVTILVTVFNSPQVADALLRCTVDEAMTDEGEHAMFSPMLSSQRSMLSVVSTIARCLLVAAREQSSPELLTWTLGRPLAGPDTALVHTRPPAATAAPAAAIPAPPPYLAVTRDLVGRLLVCVLNHERRANAVVFARDSLQVPQPAALILSEAVLGLSVLIDDQQQQHKQQLRTPSRSPTSSSCSTVSANDEKIVALCKILHLGCGLFWAKLERTIGTAATFKDWVARPKADVPSLCGHIVRSRLWELLSACFASAAGPELHVPRYLNASVAAALLEGFRRELAIERQLWMHHPSSGNKSSTGRASIPLAAAASSCSTLTAGGADDAQAAPIRDVLHRGRGPSATNTTTILNASTVCCGMGDLIRPPRMPTPTSIASSVPEDDAVVSANAVSRAQASSSSAFPETDASTTVHQLALFMQRKASPWKSWLSSSCNSGVGGALSQSPALIASDAESRRLRVVREIGLDEHCPMVLYWRGGWQADSSRRTTPRPSTEAPPAPPSLPPVFLGHHVTRASWTEFNANTAAATGGSSPLCFTEEAEQIVGLLSWPVVVHVSLRGTLVVQAQHRQRGDGTASTDEDEDWLGEEFPTAVERMRPGTVEWNLCDVRDCFVNFRIRMQRTGLLIKHVNGDMLLLKFATEAQAKRVTEFVAMRLLAKTPQASISRMRTERIYSVAGTPRRPEYRANTDTSYSSVASSAEASAKVWQSLWLQGSITNFEYLMRLNVLAGRTCADLSQYPIFPWILSNGDGDSVLDLVDSRSIALRDLSWPIACQTATQRDKLMERYQQMRVILQKEQIDHDALAVEINDKKARGEPLTDAEAEFDRGLRHLHTREAARVPYHQSTVYSSPLSVLHFLVRLEPYTSWHRALHDGRMDCRERSFTSVAQSLTSSGMLFEAIPEMFYLPEMFLCDRNTVTDLNDVELPKWAQGSPWRFVAGHRALLESAAVTEHLGEWIDLIFGCRQSGRNAIEKLNTFPPMLREQWAREHLLDDEPGASVAGTGLGGEPCRSGWGDDGGGSASAEKIEMLTLARGMWDNVGQIPLQLFREPHPAPKWATGKAASPRRVQDSFVTRTIRNPALDECPTAATEVVHMLAHQSGRLYLLLQNGNVVVVLWKGLPGDTQDPVAEFRPFSHYAKPLCLLHATLPAGSSSSSASRTTRDGWSAVEHPVFALYTSRLRPNVLYLCPLTSHHDDDDDDSDDDGDVGRGAPSHVPRHRLVPIQLRYVCEEVVPDATSPIESAFVMRTLECDLVAGGAGSGESLNVLVATCQENGSVTLWRTEDPCSVFCGLTAVGRLYGASSLVRAIDANPFADLVVSVSRGRVLIPAAWPSSSNANASASESPWRALVHQLSTCNAVATLPLGPVFGGAAGGAAATTTPTSQFPGASSTSWSSEQPSVVVMHAPYLSVLIALGTTVAGFHPTSGAVMFRSTVATPLLLRRAVESAVFLASPTWCAVFREWWTDVAQFFSAGSIRKRQSSQVFPVAQLQHRHRLERTTSFHSRSSGISSLGTPCGEVPSAPTFMRLSAVTVDSRLRSTCGPSALRVVGVTLASDGTLAVYA